MRNSLAFVGLALILAGCDRTEDTLPGPSITISGPTVVPGLTITGESNLSPGSRSQMRSFLEFSDGTRHEVTSQTIWSVDKPSVAVIETDGWMTAMATGSAEVSGRHQKMEGRKTITVNVANASTQGPSSDSGAIDDPASSPIPTPVPGQCLPEPLPSEPPSPVPCPFPLPASVARSHALASEIGIEA